MYVHYVLLKTKIDYSLLRILPANSAIKYVYNSADSAIK